jgi:uncharacterized membrane protein YphA (DoxX/SURF4 family)
MFGVPEDNPFKDFFNSMAGAAWADWLFMLGLLGIGLALTLGIGMRVAAGAGALLYLLMYAASLPLENNPVVDDHLLGAISVIVLALTSRVTRGVPARRGPRLTWSASTPLSGNPGSTPIDDTDGDCGDDRLVARP